MKKKIFMVAAVIIGSQLQAQEPGVQPGDSTKAILDEVVLTANRYPKKQSETGKVITVINRAQLENSRGRSIGELLNTVAGVTIIGANNNPGTNQTASIRGASAGNTLILIDGIPVSDPSVNNNYFDLNLFTTDQVERIEILKGGQSTLYGSDAVAGVINIITKKPRAEKWEANGTLVGGSFGALKESVGLSGRKKAIDVGINYTHMAAKGFSSAYDKSRSGDFDKDGFDQHIADARLGIAISKKLKTTVFATYSQYKTDLDASAFTDEKDYTVNNTNARAGMGWAYTHKDGILRVNYQFNYVERNYLDDSVYKSSPYVDYSKSQYIGRTHYAEVFDNWKWKNWELVAGLDYRMNNTSQYYFSTGMFGPYDPPAWSGKMNQVSPYASLVFHRNGFSLEGGGRFNIHSEYGNNFTYTFNPSYLINGRVKLFANLYSAFKAPTLYQLFDPGAGNKELNPEKADMQEAGVEWFGQNGLRARITGFYQHTKDAIVYTYNPATFESRYLNVSVQKNYGFETELNYTKGKWQLMANYTFTDGKTKSGYDGTGVAIGKDTTYYNLYRIPKHAVNVECGVQISRAWFVSTRFRYVSKREEFIYGGMPESMKAYGTLNVYGKYAWNRKIQLFADIRNITNTHYFEVLGYNAKRFNVMAGINFRL